VLRPITGKLTARTGYVVPWRNVCRRLFGYGMDKNKITTSPVNREIRLGFCHMK
jgi:hypothetical protein